MLYLEILIIAFLIFFQSIFGIGLLLIGTPTFLLIGYSFLDVLSILLPISITISSIQFFLSNVKNKKFVYNFNFFCLPILIISLYFIINNIDRVNLELFISILIIFFSILGLNKKKFKYLKNITATKQKIFLSLLGFIHGLSNLGGALLTILSSAINDGNKNKTRHCIAYGYLIMGIIQILAIYFFSEIRIKIVNLLYIGLVFLIYFPTQKIFNNLNEERFLKFLNIFALFYGVIILINNI